jgi:transcriptional regulator with XRE-family HTH domain
MSGAFHTKLAFTLKALSLSRGALAAELGVDKSLVGRWVSGRVRPSAHNLSRLSDVVAARHPGFTALDWERPIGSLAALIGADPETLAGSTAPNLLEMLPLALLNHSRATTSLRAAAYQGFFRSTRPYAEDPGAFLHDHLIIRPHPNGLLSYEMRSASVKVEGWVLLLQHQLFVIGAELTSGAFAFAILNGVSTARAGRLDGLTLYCAMDPTRTPTAAPVLLERIGDLSGDPAADEARLAEYARLNPVAKADEIPGEIVAHLTRNMGPDQLVMGGDLLLRAPAARSLSRSLGAPN